jgi:transmembrane sensor
MTTRGPSLRVPIGAVLQRRLDSAHVRRLWTRVRGGRRRGRFSVKTLAAFAFGAIAMLVAALSLLPVAPSPLHLRGGSEIPDALDARGATVFDDGSSIALSAGAHVDLLESTGRVFALALRRGATEFDVTPGGPRRWRIECGPVTIDVVGTHFTIERTKELVRVSVSRGVVLVRGDAVRDRVRRLTAGQRLEVPLSEAVAASTSMNAAPPQAVSSVETPREPDPAKEPAHPSPPRAAPTEGAPAAPAEPSAATASAGLQPQVSDREAITRLFDAADTARRAGRLSDASLVLERIVRDYPADPRSALAEFSLGRLSLDGLGDAPSAAQHFTRALAVGLPATLSEDARARLVEALGRAGDEQAAAAAAARYRAIYPDGRFRADVDRWGRAGR